MDNKLRQYALLYYNQGFNVTHIALQKSKNVFGEIEFTLKKPSHEYESLETRRQPLKEVLSFDWEDATGVGAVMGFNKLRSIDIDGCSDESFVFEMLNEMGLPNNYEWVVRTGSGNGFQIIIYSENLNFEIPERKVLSLFPTIDYESRFDHLELVWLNQIVLPPSLHISGKNYSFFNNHIPLTNPTEIVVEDLENYLRKVCIFKNKAQNKIVSVDENIDDENSTTSYSSDKTEILNKRKKVPYLKNFISDQFAYKSIINSSGTTFKGLYEEPFYFFIDIETNGLPDDYPDPIIYPEAYPDIIQIAVLVCDSAGKRIFCGDRYIAPFCFDIKDDVKSILKLDKQKMRWSIFNILNKGDKSSKEFFEDISSHIHRLFLMLDVDHKRMYDTKYIIGHNIEYDINCLVAFYERNKNKIEFKEFSVLFYIEFINSLPNLKKVCTMKETIDFCGVKNKYGNKFPKLEELYYKLFKEKIEGSHNAVNDVFNTAKCYWKLRELTQIE